jgi:hypothetical protein
VLLASERVDTWPLLAAREQLVAVLLAACELVEPDLGRHGSSSSFDRSQFRPAGEDRHRQKALTRPGTATDSLSE